MSDQNKEIIQAAAMVLCDAALNLIEADPHSFGMRPCATCKAVSEIVGREWGCNKVRAQAKPVSGRE